MKLRANGRKANGSKDSGVFWYIVSEYIDKKGQPSFTMSTNINKAKYFTKEDAHAFNRKFIELGLIDSPFDIVK